MYSYTYACKRLEKLHVDILLRSVRNYLCEDLLKSQLDTLVKARTMDILISSQLTTTQHMRY